MDIAKTALDFPKDEKSHRTALRVMRSGSRKLR
jgi:hypothetical protein